VVLGSFLNTQDYSTVELVLYVGGFLGWVPAYAMILWIGWKQRRLEIPVLAAVGNITWELLWGFFFGQDMGWGLQLVYQGAFVMDACIFYLMLRYGRDQTDNPLVRDWYLLIVAGLVAGWTALYIGIQETEGLENPLGAVSAYVVTLAESAIFLWFGLSRDDAHLNSLTVAWSKFVGTGLVTIFVFLQYDQPLIQVLSILVGILDVAYIVVLTDRRRHHHLPALGSAAVRRWDTSSSGVSPAP
jgi:hypothetical protein